MAAPAPAPARTRPAVARPQVGRPAPRPVPGPGAAAPRRRPEAPAPRPRLRLVDDARLKAAQRRRRTRLIVVAAAFVATGLLFALAAFNAVLVSGQGRLDDLERRVSEAQSEYSANRLRAAELESPDRIVSEAQERLGMVPPDRVTYLTPSGDMAAQAGTDGADGREKDTAEGPSWAAAKPYLTSTRP